MNLSAHHVSLPKVGETANGDAVVFRAEGEWTLFALIDALGHGPKAAQAAALAIEALHEVGHAAAIASVIDLLHVRLRDSRGAAAMVCIARGQALEGCSVGNVELRSRTGTIAWLPSPGILGSQLRKARLFSGHLGWGERLLLFSDGISRRLAASDVHELSADAACHRIITEHRRDHDDATILVIDVER